MTAVARDTVSCSWWGCGITKLQGNKRNVMVKVMKNHIRYKIFCKKLMIHHKDWFKCCNTVLALALMNTIQQASLWCLSLTRLATNNWSYTMYFIIAQKKFIRNNTHCANDTTHSANICFSEHIRHLFPDNYILFFIVSAVLPPPPTLSGGPLK